jgi:hypothetical protein
MRAEVVQVNKYQISLYLVFDINENTRFVQH